MWPFEFAFPGKAFYGKAMSNNGRQRWGTEKVGSTGQFQARLGAYWDSNLLREGERKTEILAQQRFLDNFCEQVLHKFCRPLCLFVAGL